jgi:hypothetical protein
MAPLRSTFDRVEPRGEAADAGPTPLDVFSAQRDLVRDAVVAMTRTPTSPSRR